MKRPQRVNRTDRAVFGEHEFFQGLRAIDFSALHQVLLGEQPPIRHIVIQCGHQLRGGGCVERFFHRLRLIPDDAIDTTARMIAQRIFMCTTNSGFRVVTTVRHTGGGIVLDDEILPVRHPHRAIGADLGINR